MNLFVNSNIITDEAIAKIGVVATLDIEGVDFRGYKNALLTKIDTLIEEYIQSAERECMAAGEEFDEDKVLADIATRVEAVLGTSISEPSISSIIDAILNSPNLERYLQDVKEKFDDVLGRMTAKMPNIAPDQKMLASKGKAVPVKVGKGIFADTDLFAFLESLGNYGVPNINLNNKE